MIQDIDVRLYIFLLYASLCFCRLFDKDGAKVVIDATSFELVKGATVDYEQDMMRSAFAIVNNPQSESACGCGSSFAVKNFSANPAID